MRRSARRRVSASLLLLPACCWAAPQAAAQQAPKASLALADLPETHLLPDPFAFADGTRVASKEDWARRREEIAGLLEDYQYGHLPPRAERQTFVAGPMESDEPSGARMQTVTVTMENAGKSADLDVTLVMPGSAAGPAPVVVQGSFPWGRARSPAERLKVFLDRGYAVAEFRKNAVAADSRDGSRSGLVYDLFGDQIDCGALMAWAWGMHRVIDALETVDAVDAAKVVVTGHSRYGKAALIAGAFDERVAVTVPSHSGCAGTAPYRYIYGDSEELHNIVGAFPHWFRADFNRFVGHVEQLPFDQHMLRALVAPRAQLSTEGTRDPWTNPEGSQLTYRAALEVYRFLGAGDRLSIRFRPVGHVPSNEDLLDFADHVLYGKPLPEGFGELPYDVETGAYAWSAPEG